VDGNGNMAITGQAASPLDFVGDGSYLLGGAYFVATLTISGNVAPVYHWAKRAYATGYGIGFDSAGHLLSAGTFQGTVDFGGILATAPVMTDGFVVQYAN